MPLLCGARCQVGSTGVVQRVLFCVALADVIRVMPYWPRDRYIELAPKYWARTRARLDAAELARPLGLISVPSALPSEEQRASR